jgi:hypothetical protein
MDPDPTYLAIFVANEKKKCRQIDPGTGSKLFIFFYLSTLTIFRNFLLVFNKIVKILMRIRNHILIQNQNYGSGIPM